MMNDVKMAVCLMAVLCGTVFANTAPVVSNVNVSQRTDGSGTVDIYYTLSDADNDRCTVSIAVSNDHKGNDFDYDLLSGGYPAGREKHGFTGKPRYVQGAGFDFENKTGMFQLAPGSMGIDAGTVIPNFCEIIEGNHPDLGAHESGTGKMQFGVKAQFIPPPVSR